MFRAGRNRSNAPFRTAAVSRSAGLERVVERLRRRRHCVRPGQISMLRGASTHTENLREECIGADNGLFAVGRGVMSSDPVPCR